MRSINLLQVPITVVNLEFVYKGSVLNRISPNLRVCVCVGVTLVLTV